MISETAGFLPLKNGQKLAYRQQTGSTPGILFLGGFRSDMTGTKAKCLADWCSRYRRAFLRFDYSGHGASSGEFEQGTIGRWLEEALTVLDTCTKGPQILVGSSLGGWIALLMALRRKDRVQALVTLACAADFTEALFRDHFSDRQRQQLQRDGKVLIPSDYDDTPYPIARELIEEGRQHLLLNHPIPLHCPVRMLHGMKDPDVPFETSVSICRLLESRDARLTLLKESGHRLSAQRELHLMLQNIEELLAGGDH